MTILTMNRQTLEKKIGKVTDAMQKTITNMGTPIEFVSDTEVAVEVFPNRPDLLSLENFARAVNQYKGKARVASFVVNKPEVHYEVIIDKSVKGVRNHTACCIVKGLSFTDETIKDIIDLQEKLHNSIGRKRTKAAIGIYPLEKITLPITFCAKDPNTVTFKPLEYPKAITARQVLSKHETGRAYADLLKGFDTFPFFIDKSGEVLSMPPIINSESTGRITTQTREVFIECSGNNRHYLEKTLNIIAATLHGMGGKIYAMQITDKKDGSFVSPNLEPELMSFTLADINTQLGLTLTERDIQRLLSKMGIGCTNNKKGLQAHIPPYRTDILHWIDLVEEVAIAYGYENFEPLIPKIATIAEESKMSKKKRTIAHILAGAGLLEVSTFHLTTKKNIKKIYFDTAVDNLLDVIDSKTERDTLRHDLITNLMHVFSENSDAQYPQSIFEQGIIFEQDTKEETGVKETERLAIAIADEQVSFTKIKQLLDYLMRMLGITYTLSEPTQDHPAFIKGRVGAIQVNNAVVGYIGEVAPRVLKNWKIKVPVVALEIDADAL